MLTTTQGTWSFRELALWRDIARSPNRREASPTASRALRAMLGGCATATHITQARSYIERMSLIRC